MDFEQYTNISALVNSIDPKLFLPFVLGIIYGGTVMTGVWKEQWWLVVIVVALPAALYVVSMLLPMDVNLTYRLFFMGVVALGVGGLAYYVAR